MKVKSLRFIVGILIILFTSITIFAQNATAKMDFEQEECSNAEFIEQDGILIVEMESVNHGSGWRGETSVNGFTGNSYIRWAGGNKFSNPESGLTEYKIKINNAGTYHFRWHSKIMHGTEATESNDSWLRIPDASDFFARNDTSVKYPKGGKFVQSEIITNGSSSNGWMKVYSSGTTSWTWSCRTSDHDPHEIYAAFDTAGVYTVQISGRSENHALDRFVLFNDDKYSVAEATNEDLLETKCSAPLETRYSVAVNSGSGSGSFISGIEVTLEADNPPLNKEFHKWIGDTTFIDDTHNPTTILTVPELDVVLSASYSDIIQTSTSNPKAKKVKLYPNPSNSVFFIELPATGSSTIHIHDLSGKKLFESETNSSLFRIADHYLTTGTYLVSITNNSLTYNELLVIN